MQGHPPNQCIVLFPRSCCAVFLQVRQPFDAVRAQGHNFHIVRTGLPYVCRVFLETTEFSNNHERTQDGNMVLVEAAQR